MQHNVRDPNRDHQHGRIYRVTYKDRPLQKPVKIDGEPIVVGALADAVRVRIFDPPGSYLTRYWLSVPASV